MSNTHVIALSGRSFERHVCMTEVRITEIPLYMWVIFLVSYGRTQGGKWVWMTSILATGDLSKFQE